MNIYESACKLFPEPVDRLSALSLVNAARIDERQKAIAVLEHLRVQPNELTYGIDPAVIQQQVMQDAIDRIKGALKT